jgi:hypothetical protein
MPYTVQFVGLVCFFREQDGWRALLPEGSGSNPPHVASITVNHGTVLHYGGWRREEITEDEHAIDFIFPPSRIVLESVERYDALDHGNRVYQRLPVLRYTGQPVTIDPSTAVTVGEILLRNGRMESFRVPGSEDDGTAAMITQLDVPHDGTITVVATPNDGSQIRTLTVAPATEIAIVNAYREPAGGEFDNHFKIYGKLAMGQPDVDDPPDTPPNFPLSRSRHGHFNRPKEIGSSARCSNTGCCP